LEYHKNIARKEKADGIIQTIYKGTEIALERILGGPTV